MEEVISVLLGRAYKILYFIRSCILYADSGLQLQNCYGLCVHCGSVHFLVPYLTSTFTPLGCLPGLSSLYPGGKPVPELKLYSSLGRKSFCSELGGGGIYDLGLWALSVLLAPPHAFTPLPWACNLCRLTLSSLCLSLICKQ